VSSARFELPIPEMARPPMYSLERMGPGSACFLAH